MPLTRSQHRYLREQAHALKPVVMLGGKGVTPAVLGELDVALDHHELVKLRLSGDRDERERQLAALLEQSKAELVQQIGHVASLYRANPERPRLALPA